MNELEYIKLNKRRKKGFLDYLLQIVIYAFLIMFISAAVFLIINDLKNNEKTIDWSSPIFLAGFGLAFFLLIRNTHQKSIRFISIENKNSKKMNLDFVLAVIEKMKIKVAKTKIENNEEILTIETLPGLISVGGDRIIFIIMENKIMFNVRGKVSHWSIKTSELFEKLNKELKKTQQLTANHIP